MHYTDITLHSYDLTPDTEYIVHITETEERESKTAEMQHSQKGQESEERDIKMLFS